MKVMKNLKKIFIFILVEIITLNNFVWAAQADLFQSKQADVFSTLSPKLQIDMPNLQGFFWGDVGTNSRVENIYKNIFPNGIPIVQDNCLTDGDDAFREINMGLGDYEDVFYDVRLASFLARNIQIKPGDKVLDFGTGTGIHAVYAAKKGASRVVALDVDEIACRVAIWNSVKFGVHNIMHVVKSDGYKALREEDLFNTIVFFAATYTDNKNETNVAVRDYKGKNIKMFIKGAGRRLLPGGKIKVLYPDNPSSRRRLKELGLNYGLIITEQIQWGSPEKLRDFYRTKFKPERMNITTDIMREEMAKKGWFSWSVFKLEKYAEVVNSEQYEKLLHGFGKNSNLEKYEKVVNLEQCEKLLYGFGKDSSLERDFFRTDSYEAASKLLDTLFKNKLLAEEYIPIYSADERYRKLCILHIALLLELVNSTHFDEPNVLNSVLDKVMKQAFIRPSRKNFASASFHYYVKVDETDWYYKLWVSILHELEYNIRNRVLERKVGLGEDTHIDIISLEVQIKKIYYQGKNINGVDKIDLADITLAKTRFKKMPRVNEQIKFINQAV